MLISKRGCKKSNPMEVMWMNNGFLNETNVEYEGYSVDKEYIYLTTICPLCGETKLQHFIPIGEEILREDILEQACMECQEIVTGLKKYDYTLEQL